MQITRLDFALGKKPRIRGILQSGHIDKIVSSNLYIALSWLCQKNAIHHCSLIPKLIEQPQWHHLSLPIERRYCERRGRGRVAVEFLGSKNRPHHSFSQIALRVEISINPSFKSKILNLANNLQSPRNPRPPTAETRGSNKIPHEGGWRDWMAELSGKVAV